MEPRVSMLVAVNAGNVKLADDSASKAWWVPRGVTFPRLFVTHAGICQAAPARFEQAALLCASPAIPAPTTMTVPLGGSVLPDCLDTMPGATPKLMKPVLVRKRHAAIAYAL